MVSCVRPGEARTERDLEVGKTEVSGIQFQVEEGLATVRGSSAGALRLWASAPNFHVKVQRPAASPRRFVLTIENAMPALELRGAVTIEQFEEGLVTRKSWLVDLPPGSSRLSFAVAGSETPGAFRFAVLSDVQEAIDDVGDIYRKMNATPDLSFLLGAGDLTRQGAASELRRFQKELGALDIPYYTTLGNHELGQGLPPYQEWFGRMNFHFVFRGVHFTFLDSGSATLDPLVYDWLDGWLRRGKDGVHVVSTHIPPLDPIGVRNGGFASRAEAAKLLGRLAKGGVDLTLYGHIHSYYDFDNAGIPAYISGGGGAIPERFDNVGRHFLVVDVDAKTGVKNVKLVEVD